MRTREELEAAGLTEYEVEEILQADASEITIPELIKARCRELNTPENDEIAARDYNGNTGDYRLATHAGADYAYISNWYGIAMSSVDPNDYEEFGICAEEVPFL
uniref:Uncharacterized protein n=1 Tax=viral metagenome TaxID=1070528 RepID=A0A6M3L6F3_9ZZZZ